MGTRELLRNDFAFAWHHNTRPSGRVARLAYYASQVLTVRGLATVGVRLAHAAGKRNAGAGIALKQLTQMITGADIDYRAEIGPGLRLLHPGSVVIASDAVIGDRCTIHSCVTIGSSLEGAPKIGDSCDLAPGCRVIGAITLGNRVRVYPNAVVTQSF